MTLGANSEASMLLERPQILRSSRHDISLCHLEHPPLLCCLTLRLISQVTDELAVRRYLLSTLLEERLS